MPPKGEKGFSLPKGGKSALKSLLTREDSLKGKEDGSAKSKRGRKVQFEADGSAASSINGLSNGGKSDSSIKGDWAKGGKGGKTMNGGKTVLVKEPAPLELKVDEELPKNCKCLMDCEAAHILKGIQDQMIILSEDPTIKLPPAFDKALEYAKAGSHYKIPQSVRPVLLALKKYGVTDAEMCVIANTGPETVDEVFALLPSLKDKKSTLREPLKDVLSELAKMKRLI